MFTQTLMRSAAASPDCARANNQPEAQEREQHPQPHQPRQADLGKRGQRRRPRSFTQEWNPSIPPQNNNTSSIRSVFDLTRNINYIM